MNRIFGMTILGIFVLLLIGVVIFTLSFNKSTKQSCADKVPAPRIIAFGDSLVAGYGATTEGGFVTLLSRQMGVPITNLGKSGDTTEMAKERINSVIYMKPDITLVLLGGNDALQGVSEAQTEQNLGEIISTIQKSGSSVILLGVLGGFPDPYSAMFNRLSKKYGVTIIPNILSGIIGNETLMSDSVHPNEAGYQKIAGKVLPKLEIECNQNKKS